MPKKPTTPATNTQRKKLLSAINRLLKEHNFSNHKIVELKVQPKSINSLTTAVGDGFSCPFPWQTPTEVILPDGSTTIICFPEKKPPSGN